MMDTQVLKELRRIPGVGKSIAADLYSLGIHSPSDLRGRDPEELYLKLCSKRGIHIDRCVLYVFRYAVYYASHGRHNPELLRWWNWKDNNRVEEKQSYT
ncbi:MAG: helix-hairpin-helix domain-containing protein [Chloroflexota bacterium]|nr:helix-hairpin-helix domain-containing protein [Chloroflexota bacterium]